MLWKILESWKESMWTLRPLEKNSDRQVFTSFSIMSGLALLTGNYTDSEEEDQNIKDSGYFVLWDQHVISSIKPKKYIRSSLDLLWQFDVQKKCFRSNLM